MVDLLGHSPSHFPDSLHKSVCLVNTTALHSQTLLLSTPNTIDLPSTLRLSRSTLQQMANTWPNFIRAGFWQVSVFVLLSLAMGVLKNPWKPYWEDKSLLKNNPYLHLKVFGAASLHCTNWAMFNDTELQQYLYPTNQPTNQPTYLPTTYLPTYQPTNQP